MEDVTLNCKDCKNDFVFTSGEVEFYAGKGFPDPIRCPECRKAKKEKKNIQQNSKVDNG